MKAWIGFLDASISKDIGWSTIKVFTNNPVHVFMMFDQAWRVPGQEQWWDRYAVYEANGGGIGTQSWKNRKDNEGAWVQDIFEINLPTQNIKAGLKYAQAKLGVKYDYTALPWFAVCLVVENTTNFFRRIFGKKEIKIRWRNIFQFRDRLFCSEFAVHDLRAMSLLLETWMRGNNTLPKDLKQFALSNPSVFIKVDPNTLLPL